MTMVARLVARTVITLALLAIIAFSEIAAEVDLVIIGAIVGYWLRGGEDDVRHTIARANE